MLKNTKDLIFTWSVKSNCKYFFPSRNVYYSFDLH